MGRGAARRSRAHRDPERGPAGEQDVTGRRCGRRPGPHSPSHFRLAPRQAHRLQRQPHATTPSRARRRIPRPSPRRTSWAAPFPRAGARWEAAWPWSGPRPRTHPRPPAGTPPSPLRGPSDGWRPKTPSRRTPRTARRPPRRSSRFAGAPGRFALRARPQRGVRGAPRSQNEGERANKEERGEKEGEKETSQSLAGGAHIRFFSFCVFASLTSFSPFRAQSSDPRTPCGATRARYGENRSLPCPS